MQRPNLRKLFIPDPNYILLEADQERADLMAVIWDADDRAYKQAIQLGANIHEQNAMALFNELTPKTYKLAKGFGHASNYGSSPRTLATMLGLSIAEAQRAQDRYFMEHPAIKHWHERVKKDLMTKGEVCNIYGQPFVALSRNATQLPAALGWIGQSTVAINCTNAMLALAELELPYGIQILSQVHDSIVFQMPYEAYPENLTQVYAALHQLVPYPDPLTINWSLKGSARSWGDAIPISWSEPTDLETLKKPK